MERAERKLAKKRKAVQEVGGIKRRYPVPKGDEVTQVAGSIMPVPHGVYQLSNGARGLPSFGTSPGACFQCGEFGHLKHDCPKKAPAG